MKTFMPCKYSGGMRQKRTVSYALHRLELHFRSAKDSDTNILKASTWKCIYDPHC